MKKVDHRKMDILKIIVEEYITTWEVTGSKSLLKKHDLKVSPATVRNDMASLEKIGLIFQPYNSAGRLPTTEWIRVFVDYLMEELPWYFLDWESKYEEVSSERNIDDVLYELVARLTKTTKEITFACVPSHAKSYYLGLSNFLEKNSLILWDEIYNVIKVLENKYHFIDLLENLNINKKVSVFIGKENIIESLESYTMIVKKVSFMGQEWYIWILGSLCMDYSFNIAALKNILR